MLAGGEEGMELLASWTEDNDMCGGDSGGDYVYPGGDDTGSGTNGFWGVVCNDFGLVSAM
jgi:hypothetical protein